MKNNNTIEIADYSEEQNDIAVVPPLQLEPDDYRDELAEFELTPEQETELLQVLWNIMSTMVDLGWGLDSVQLFSLPKAHKIDSDSSDKVKLTDNNQAFNQTAGNTTEKGNNDEK